MNFNHFIGLKEQTILIIDDDPGSLALISGFLVDRKFTILVADDSKSGIKRASLAIPDIILLDIMLPDTDGYETCRLLKTDERTKSIPVIFMTGLTGTEYKVKGFEAGAVDYITKPFQREEVLARVEVHLHNQELKRKLLEDKELLELRVKERTEELARTNKELRKEIAEREKTENALRVSEEKYRSIFENSVEGIFQSSLSGRLFSVNPSMARIYGFESPGEMVMYYTDINKQLYVDPEKQSEFQKILATEGTVENFESQHFRKDGSKIWVSVSARAVRDADGTMLYYEGSNENITARKQAEEDRNILANQLIQAQKMEAIGTLAGGIAHDFNNILSGIMGYSELCLKALHGQTDARYYIEQSLKAVDRAKELVQHILLFSRKNDLEKKPIEPFVVVKEALKFMRASLPANIEIKQNISEALGVIMADVTQIHQVIVNLCTNAGHAMKDSGGVIEITTEAISMIKDGKNLPKGRYLELTVRDTGHGIPDKSLGKIFDPYFTTKDKGEGTGLGLSVVHGIVKDHDGDIKVYSEQGKGATFKVYIPFIERRCEDRPEVEQTALQSGSEKILFLDDEKMIVDMNKELLQMLGYEVITETDPVKAVKIFSENCKAFDLVITDKIMPSMSGYDVAREIGNICPGFPVILCTGLEDGEDKHKLKKLGISQFIIKPIRINTLAATVREVLDKNLQGRERCR